MIREGKSGFGETVLLSVLAGTPNDARTNNTTLRVMQPAADQDFEIEVKFESEPTQKYQSQGVLAEQDPSNYVPFDDVYSDGGSLRVCSATFANGSPTVRVRLVHRVDLDDRDELLPSIDGLGCRCARR